MRGAAALLASLGTQRPTGCMSGLPKSRSGGLQAKHPGPGGAEPFRMHRISSSAASSKDSDSPLRAPGASLTQDVARALSGSLASRLHPANRGKAPPCLLGPRSALGNARARRARYAHHAPWDRQPGK